MLIAGVFSFIGNSAQEFIVGLFLLIDSLVYNIISWLYQIFLVLASFRLFESSMYESVTNSIMAIIGVVALFIIAYELLKNMINIDASKGGSVIKKIIINLVTSMLMIVLVPTMFSFMYDVQNSILNSNVLGKLLLPTYNSQEFNNALNEYGISDSSNISETDFNYYSLKHYGNSTAIQLFQAFFYPTNANIETFSKAADDIKTEGEGTGNLVDILKWGSCIAVFATSVGTTVLTGLIGSPSLGAASAYCVTVFAVDAIGDSLVDILDSKYSLANAYNYASVSGDFSIFQPFAKNIINREITYHYFLSNIVGVVVCYILAVYCIDLALRSVKLAFYQIIAPLPIFMRIMPKQEKVFDNWWKAVLSTYFEVFIRMFILYLGVFLISYLPNIMGNIFASGSTPYTENIIIYLLVRVIIILGVFIFIKQMPSIIENVTGIKSGKFSLNIIDHLKEAAWAPAAVGGLIASKGNPMAMLRAGSSSWKNNNLQSIGAEVSRRRNLEEARRNGSTFRGRVAEHGRRILGLETGVDEMNRRTEDYYDYANRRQMSAHNDSGIDIGELDGNGNLINTIIRANGDYELTRQSVERLHELDATIAERDSELEEEGRILKNRRNQNDTLISAKGKLEEMAEKEIKKNKFRLKDEKGRDLKLSYRKLNEDGTYQMFNGNYVYETINHSNLVQFEDWFNVNKDRMSSEDLRVLSDLFKKSVAVYTKEAFVDSNGVEELLNANGTVQVDANGHILYSKAHQDTLVAKKNIAFDMVNKGFVDASGTLQNNAYNQLLSDLNARGINTRDPNFRLDDYITSDILKALKDEGEALNRGDIADREREHAFIQAKYSEQRKAIKRILNIGKEQQEVQKHSSRYRAAQANTKITNNKGGK